MKTLNKRKFLLSIALVGIFSIGTALSQETTTTTTTTTTGGKGAGAAPASGMSLEVGARYMPTFSSFKLQKPDGSSLKADFVLGHGFGGVLGVNFSSVLGLQGEFIYTALAQKYTYQGNERQVCLNYVNIPVLLSLNTGKYRAINLNVVAGPQFGINVGAKTKSFGSGGSDVNDSLHTVVSAKAGDVGFAYGAGLQFGLGSEHRTKLDIGFRGVTGLIDVSDKSSSQTTDDYYILDRTKVQTYAGYVGLTYLIK